MDRSASRAQSPVSYKWTGQLVEPRVQAKHGESACNGYAVCNWSKQPEDLSCAPNVATFKPSLKTKFNFSIHVPMTEV